MCCESEEYIKCLRKKKVGTDPNVYLQRTKVRSA